MLNSVVLEVGIGLILTFLMFSLILTSLQECIESILKNRAKDLQTAIGDLLDDPHGETTKLLYEHPLIFPMFKQDYEQAANRLGGYSSSLPSYIPGQVFAVALADIASGAFAGRGDKAGPATLSEQVQHVFRLADAGLDGAPSGRLAAIAQWYDTAMERLSGRYKRKTQAFLFAIGLICAGAANINPIHIADRLAHDQALRETVVAAAPVLQNEAGDNAASETKARKAVDTLVDNAGLPIGHASDPSPLPIKVAGWLITALAGMLGAPFWFDLLGRIMSIRAAVRPSGDTAAAAAAPPAAPVWNVGDADGSDCCGTGVRDGEETPDEELPPAEGGIAVAAAS